MLRNILTLCILSLSLFVSIFTYAAEPEPTLSFQGQLFDNNIPASGSVSATFTFYDAPTSGSSTGSTINKTLTVSNGYFSTAFTSSDTTGVNFNQQLYLEVSINGTPLSPRTTINPTVSSLKTLGTFSYTAAPTVGPTGSLYFNTTSNELYVSNGSVWQLAGVSSSTTQWSPNGTSLNYLAGNVGIGTTTPGSVLTVVGTTSVSSLAITDGLISVGGNPFVTMKGAGSGTQHVFFAGVDAGSGATNATYSNFMGNGAGKNSTDVWASNFFGPDAGKDVTNA